MLRTLRRVAAAVLVALVAAASLAAPLAAQITPSADPVDDLVTRVIADLNDLRYADAILRGRDVLANVRTMRPAQEALLRTAIAAAFYPEETVAQQPDSAIAQFAKALHVQPDLVIPIELRWAGLDSLLGVARTRTFAVAVSGDSAQVLVGPDGQGSLRVLSSRPARFTLRTALLGDTAQTLQASTTDAATRGTLTFRALDGRRVLLAPGRYTATITAEDAAGERTTLTRELVVAGQPLMFVAPPVFDSTQLRPETTRAPLAQTALKTLLFATATFIIGGIASGGDVEDGEVDGRSVLVGLSILGGGAWAYWSDRNRVDEEAVAFNAQLRETHRQAVENAATESESRVANYRVTVTLAAGSR